MKTLEQLQQLFDELGPQATDIDAIAEGPDGRSWAVAMTTGRILEIDWNEAGEKLAISTDLPSPSVTNRLAILEALLLHNLLWQDGSAARMAFDRLGGNPIQLSEIPTTNLDLPTLHGVLKSFVERAEVWSDFITSGASPGADDSMPVDSGLADMIRV